LVSLLLPGQVPLVNRPFLCAFWVFAAGRHGDFETHPIHLRLLHSPVLGFYGRVCFFFFFPIALCARFRVPPRNHDPFPSVFFPTLFAVWTPFTDRVPGSGRRFLGLSLMACFLHVSCFDPKGYVSRNESGIFVPAHSQEVSFLALLLRVVLFPFFCDLVPLLWFLFFFVTRV